MKFELNLHHHDIPDKELLEDLQQVAAKLNQKSITLANYRSHGNYSSDTIRRRFKTWAKAVEKAGLEAYSQQNYFERCFT